MYWLLTSRWSLELNPDLRSLAATQATCTAASALRHCGRLALDPSVWTNCQSYVVVLPPRLNPQLLDCKRDALSSVSPCCCTLRSLQLNFQVANRRVCAQVAKIEILWQLGVYYQDFFQQVSLNVFAFVKVLNTKQAAHESCIASAVAAVRTLKKYL